MRGSLVGAALLLVSAATAQAQSPILFFGGGATIPNGEYGEYAKTGWMANAGVGLPVGGKGFMVGAEVLYGSNKHEFAGDKTNLTGANGFLLYRFGDQAKTGFYVLGSGGMLNHSFKSESEPEDEGSDTKFAWSGGAGVDVPFGGNKSFWAEGRYMARSDTKFIALLVGLSFALGGGGN